MLSRFWIRIIAVLIVGLVAIAALSLHSANASGPRPSFSWSQPASYITFNSIYNNPAVGNEQHFLVVRDTSQSNYARTLQLHDGQELVFRIYYDNNAGSNLGLVAKNTQVRVSLPTQASRTPVVSAYISADNAKPQQVSDTISLTSDNALKINYQSGSTQIWNNTWRGNSLGNSLTTSGVLIGYDKFDGNVPGGPKYSGYITFKAKTAATQTGSSLSGTSVPNTGPGDMLGIFLVASAVGAVVHMSISRRKRS